MTTELHASWTAFINKVKVVVVSRLTSMEPILILSKMLYKPHTEWKAIKYVHRCYYEYMYTLATVHLDLFKKVTKNRLLHSYSKNLFKKGSVFHALAA